MGVRHPRLRGAAMAAGLLVAGAASAHEAGCEAGVPWRTLTLAAKKGLFGASLQLEVDAHARAEAEPLLRAVQDVDALTPQGECLTRLRSRVDPRPGAPSETIAWLDASRGVLEVSSEKKQRTTVRRYGSAGSREWRREKAGAPLVERRVEWPAPLPDGVPLADGTTLLYLASLRRLDAEGARLECRLPSKGRLLEVSCAAQEEVVVDGWDGEPRRARRVTLTARDPTGDGVELLGMRGGLDLLLELGTGLPLEVRGVVPKLGAVRVRLTGFDPS